jgi:hypothetical protein
MKATMLVAMGLIWSTGLWANGSVGPSGVYEGVGTGGPLGGPLKGYTTTLTIKSSDGGKAKDVVEEWKGTDEKGKSIKITWAFNVKFDPANRTLSLSKNGVKNGYGFCHQLDDGNMWCDQQMVGAEGPVYMNKFYDAKEDRIHRIGHMITPKGVVTWTDSLSKK